MNEGLWATSLYMSIGALFMQDRFWITTTDLTFPDYMHQVCNVFLKNIYFQPLDFSFLVCRDLSRNAIRHLPSRIFIGPSQLRYLYVCLHYVLSDKKSLFPAVHVVLK